MLFSLPVVSNMPFIIQLPKTPQSYSGKTDTKCEPWCKPWSSDNDVSVASVMGTNAPLRFGALRVREAVEAVGIQELHTLSSVLL